MGSFGVHAVALVADGGQRGCLRVCAVLSAGWQGYRRDVSAGLPAAKVHRKSGMDGWDTLPLTFA